VHSLGLPKRVSALKVWGALAAVDMSISSRATRAKPVRGDTAMRGMGLMHRPTMPPRSWRASAVGALGAVALHVMFLSAFTLGTSTGRSPRTRGYASTIEAPISDDGAISAVIFMDPRLLSRDEGISVPSRSDSRPVLKHLTLARLARLFATPAGLPGNDGTRDSRKATATASVDGAGRAALFGRYVSQIDARIERLWVKPQSAPYGTAPWSAPSTGATSTARTIDSAGTFRCRVQILQSRSGEVREVTLLDCDSSPKWQQSLVNAIDAASPLPAPPDQSVFARSLVLDFTSTGRAP